jgi:hypothetical protein
MKEKKRKRKFPQEIYELQASIVQSSDEVDAFPICEQNK